MNQSYNIIPHHNEYFIFQELLSNFILFLKETIDDIKYYT